MGCQQSQSERATPEGHEAPLGPAFGITTLEELARNSLGAGWTISSALAASARFAASRL
jgi:hypothetical protein